MLTFQQIILALQDYWGRQGCALLQPYDMEVGAGTSHTATFLRALGPEPWRAAYVQPTRRPKDGRYGENPNRLQHYYQYQVVLKPSPADILELYLGSLEALGFDLKKNDVRFVEDDWENPTLGAWGLGWEVWLNGMEVTQFTYFQQVGGIDCKPITGEITYGLERLAMYLQGVDNVFDLVWTERTRRHQRELTYGDVYHQNEVEQTTYNFEQSKRRALRAVRVLRVRGEAAARSEAGAARLRADAQGGAHLQPARRARRDHRHRARRLHRPHPRRCRGWSRRLRTSRARRWASRCCRAAARQGWRWHERRATLAVELFTEELPPKALKRLGEAFAEGSPTACKRAATAPRVSAIAVSRRRAGSRSSITQRASRIARPAVHAEADAGRASRSTPRASRRRRCARSWRLGRGVSRPTLVDAGSTDARARRQGRGAVPRSVACPAARFDGPAGGARRRDRQAADPEGDELPARRRLLQRRQVRAPGARLVALHGADVVPVTALGLDAGRTTDGHRFLGRRDIDDRDADAYAETLRAEGTVIASFAERRAEIVAGARERRGRRDA